MRTGRPEKLSKVNIEQQMEMMAMLGIRDLYKVAQVFGVTPATMSRYAKRYPQLIDAFERGKERGALKLKNKAWSMGMAGNWQALKYCLENLTDWQDKAQPGAIERTQVIVYLPALEDDPSKPARTLEIGVSATNGNGKHEARAMEAPPRPAD